MKARAILDSGSQRTYVTGELKNTLGLTAKSNESIVIKTFGSSEQRVREREVVEIGMPY